MTDKTFEKYKRVVDEWFVNGFNGVRAYQKVYPKSSYKSADTSFRKILEIPRIKEYVSERQEKARETLEITHETVLKELANWAFSDFTQTMLLSPAQIKEMPEDIRRLITKHRHIKRTSGKRKKVTEEIIELTFVSKERAMEMINRHLGFYEEDNRQNNPSIQEILLLTPEERRARIIELRKEANKNGSK
tara:strand:- start:36 stop:605 length:570 start_codon:yes stop_codon:yes gene_type:complete